MELLQHLDSNIVLWVRENLNCGFLDSSMPLVSALGNHGEIWILLGIGLLFMGKRTRKWGILLLLSLAVTAALANLILKPAFARVRPFQALGLSLLIPQPLDYSFPSGHTMAAVTAAVVLKAMNSKVGRILYIFAAVMAFSRLYLGVHYPSDIVAGAVLGWAVTKAILWCFRRKQRI